MSEPARSHRYMTVQEYLAYEVDSHEKHEYRDGLVVAMAGVTENHDFVSSNLNRSLGNRLLDGRCRVHTSDLKVQVDPNGRFVYPDATVVCGPSEFRADEQKRRTLVNPRIVFEVLSDSTRAYDLDEKLRHYREVPSVEEVVFLEQDRPELTGLHRQPDGTWSMQTWRGRDATARVRCLGLDLPLGELYLNVPVHDDAETPGGA